MFFDWAKYVKSSSSRKKNVKKNRTLIFTAQEDVVPLWIDKRVTSCFLLYVSSRTLHKN